MSNEDFGFVTWDENVGSDNKSNNNNDNKGIFLRLQHGSNRVRILTRPSQYWYHKYKEFEEDPGYGSKITCSLRRDKDKNIVVECPLCTEEFKRLRRWYVGVIDRRTQTYKICDMSSSVYQSVRSFARDDDWGDPTQYDIDIVVDKNAANPKDYYSVVPKPAKPLSKDDLIIKNRDVDLDVLKRLVEPPTVERVLSKIQAVKDKMADKRKPNDRAKQVQRSDDSQYDFSQEQ